MTGIFASTLFRLEGTWKDPPSFALQINLDVETCKAVPTIKKTFGTSLNS